MKRDLLRPQVLRLRAEGAPLRMTSGGDIPVRAKSVPCGLPFSSSPFPSAPPHWGVLSPSPFSLSPFSRYPLSGVTSSFPS